MKTRSRPSAAAALAALLSVAPLASAVEKAPTPATPAAPADQNAPADPRPSRPPLRRPPGPPSELETVGFLGVEVAPADPATRAQLSLPRETGLAVVQVAPGSPAAGVLQEHDVLLQLDDQLLIDVHQLAVLVRNHREGDEVALTYVRGGRKATAKVKIGRQQVPKGELAGPRFRGPPEMPPGGGQHRFPAPWSRRGQPMMGPPPEATEAPPAPAPRN